MLRQKRKQKTRWGMIIFLLVLGAALGAYIYYQDIVAVRWKDIQLVFYKPDVSAVLHNLRREQFGVLCVHEKDCYVFDRAGVIFDKARTIVGDVIVKLDEVSDREPTINAPLIDANSWHNLYPLLVFVGGKKVAVSRMVLRRAEREVVVTLLLSGARAYVSLEFNPSEHLNALGQLEKKIDFAKLEYLDLRVEGKIFYR